MKFVDFFLIMYPFMLVPGPAMALVSRNSAKFGMKETNFYICGIFSSILFFSVLSILGIVSIIQLYPLAFKVFKICGALYLSIVGIKIFLFAKKNNLSSSGEVKKSSKTKQYISGLLTDLANPLSMVGITSMILGFVNPADPMSVKFGYLITTMISALCYLYTYSFLFGNKITRKFVAPRMIIFEKLAGIAVFLIGVTFFIKAI